ncbi:aminoglycoside phosphotransferase family protein [Streptantibioticus silvisoli]|uniref:Aminoglycoside phosphotransferase family protein n=1 Tax=Streptantibioticus silvisoli TaxID=2705255 RepID=A0ABT6W4E6_9ACTN|nr:aminoglycoside phosphotransferase family protein [Streptantibioticus silvisoli]MDI5965633.1 aminoglycoside phosphotransferase family protein [Streptantibioticus silvisoli]
MKPTSSLGAFDGAGPGGGVVHGGVVGGGVVSGAAAADGGAVDGAAAPADRPAPLVDVPPELAANHTDFFGAAGSVWIAGLPALARERMAGWRLTRDGPAAHGVVALVLPVRCADGTRAALKLQPVDEETGGEPAALRAWHGRGAVRLLDHHPASGSMLLERLDAARSLAAEPDERAAVTALAALLGRLAAVPAPPGLRRLADLAADLLRRVPAALPRLADPAEARLLDACAGAVRPLLAEPGDRLLHWDLHYANVLAPLPGADRGDWLAIDPKPLAGDPGFELFPALRNRWPAIAADSAPRNAVLRRYDLMTEVAALDRGRAAGWTLGRVLQNALWDIESGATHLAEDQVVVGGAVLRRVG